MNLNKLKYGIVLLALILMMQACNKELPEATPIESEKSESNETIMQKLNAPEYSILKAAVEKANTFASTTGKIVDVLSNPTGELTFVAPDDAALLRSFALLGLPANAASLSFFSAGKLDTLLKYHIIGGQLFRNTNISTDFPNMYLQSSLVLAPPSATLPPGLRMPIFLSKAGTTSFVNAVPVTGSEIMASNGVMHKTYIALLPPEVVLWQRIATDDSYSYFRAAVLKADEGDANKTLQTALSNPAANLTVFVPTNAAFQALLTAQITQGVLPIVKQTYITTGLVPMIKAGNPGISDATALTQATALAETEPHKTSIMNTAVAQATSLASSPDVFTNPALASVLTARTVKGLVVYHILGKRAFTVNFPATETKFPTLLNTDGEFVNHPGVSIRAVLGASGTSSATVKGAANVAAANIAINPLSNGTSDQNCINGVIHRIDQVLLPQ